MTQRVLASMRVSRPTLSDREVQVLRLVAAGESNRDIARALFLTAATVKTHLVHVFTKLGVYSRTKPDAVRTGFGCLEFDNEGRYTRADVGNLTVISVYCPSGSSSPERQEAKFRFMEVFLPHLQELKAEGREIVICGDWNIAHKEIDLKNWKGNQKNSGFLPEERAWMTRIFDELGLVDVHRGIDQRPEQYTWWSNRGQAWAKNVGWRIDYHVATPGIAAKAHTVSIYKDERFSDHAPLIIDYHL